ncbi:hypothetical protein BDZ45DRAFT_740160 [Acephala macrosclerotiorum]|nr:hypothetical protein BDZ45DRAFT_740160 [Acephala macrosclerotiorum]
MACGIINSKKSTLTRTIASQCPNFIPLSIDKYIFENHGVYDLDYPWERYGELQEELGRLVREGKRDVVLDLSFWNREMRDGYRGIALKGKGERGWEGERRSKYEIVVVVLRGQRKRFGEELRDDGNMTMS